MALKSKDWKNLLKEKKKEVVSFLNGNCKFELQTPAKNYKGIGSPIKDGKTKNGFSMKFGKQNRIYIKDTKGCPDFLRDELKDTPKGSKYQARVGGNKAILAILEYIADKF